MIVVRSMFRPAAPAPKTTKLQRDLREALASVKHRRKPPVTLPQLRALVKAQGEGGCEQ